MNKQTQVQANKYASKKQYNNNLTLSDEGEKKKKHLSDTVKVVIFARVIFHASATFDIFVCFKIHVFQPSYIDLHTK